MTTFKKLLSNLSFNPSLVEHVSFYTKRLHAEASVRRFGLVFLSMAMVVQIFAVVSPPEASLAASPFNDILPGGITSVSDAHQHCLRNSHGFATILKGVNATCDNLRVGTKVSLRSTDYNRQLFSMGHLPYGKTGEFAFPIAGVGTTYMRPLWAWDTRGASTYSAVSMRDSAGKQMFILFNCGNVVTIGKPVPPKPPIPPKPPTPKPPVSPKPPEKPCLKAGDENDTIACLILHKTAMNSTQKIANANGTTAHAGDTIVYLLKVTNEGKVAVKNFVFEENISDVLDYADIVDLHGGTLGSGNVITWSPATIGAGQTAQHQITVKIKDVIPATPTSTSDAGHFDMQMTNVYGDTVNIKLPPSVIKAAEVLTTQEIPNTGPGTTLAVAFTVTVLAGYFLARSRLMAKELDIVRADIAVSGGAS